MDSTAAGRVLLETQRIETLQIVDNAKPLAFNSAGAAFSRESQVTLALNKSEVSKDDVYELALAALQALSPGTVYANRQTIVFSAIPNEFAPAVERALEACGRIVTFREPCRMVLAPVDKTLSPKPVALDAALQDGYTWCHIDGTVYQMGSCAPHDVPCMLQHWKYASPSAAATIKREVTQLPSAAVRSVRRWGTTSVRQLVAWCLLRSDGSMGMLHVTPPHRKRGLARRAIAALLQKQQMMHAPSTSEMPQSSSSQCSLARISPWRGFAFLADYNTASQQLFTSQGFESSTPVTWLVSSKVKLPSLICRTLCAPCPAVAPVEGVMGGAVRADLGAPEPEPLGPHTWHAVYAAMNAAYREDDGFALDQLRVEWAHVRELAQQCGTFDPSTSTSSPQALLCLTPADCTAGAAQGVPPIATEDWWAQLHASKYAPVAPSSLLPGFIHVSGQRVHVSQLPRAMASACTPLRALPPTAAVMRVDLGWLCVAPFYKGRGLSGALLQQAQRWAQVQASAGGCHGALLCCHIISVKPWLPQWYAQQGFVVYGSARWPAGMRHQLKRDALFWAAAKWVPVQDAGAHE